MLHCVERSLNEGSLIKPGMGHMQSTSAFSVARFIACHGFAFLRVCPNASNW